MVVILIWGPYPHGGAIPPRRSKTLIIYNFIQREIKAKTNEMIQMIVDRVYNPLFIILNMSYIIEQLDNSPYKPRKHIPTSPPSLAPAPPSPSLQIDKEKDYLMKSLGRFANSIISTSLSQTQIDIHLLLNNVFRHVSIILKIKLNPKTQQLHFLLSLLTNEHKIVTIGGKERRLLFCKVLVNRFYLSAFQQFKITVNMNNGQLQLSSPVYDMHYHNYSSLSKLILHVVKTFYLNHSFLLQPVNFTKEILHESSKHFHEAHSRKEMDPRIRKIFYYSQFSNVSINLTQESTNQQRSIVLKQQKELESIHYLKNNYVSLKNRNGLDLFAIVDFNLPKNQVSNFQLSFLEREEITEKTAPPCMQKSKNPHQNNYVLNFIKMNKKLDDKSLKKINAGGFTNIFLAQIQYWYVGSYCDAVVAQPSNMKSNPPHKKYIVVKREDRNQLQAGKKSRIAHEKVILKKIKNGTSMFLPKYYLNTDRQNDMDNELMIDFISYPTLADYITKNKDTLSYQTKIYLGYIIAQGLRYLQEYQIAHLDLKPSNIMLYKKMMIKLIDFGESYHPDVKNHQPGFSVPYSAPQNYNFPASYDHKSDVFSLGVILHQLFLSKYPFYFYDQKKREKCYRKDCVSNYWFCSPEENANFGDTTIFPLLQLLVGKCLSPNPYERPELEWIVLILRECLDYLC